MTDGQDQPQHFASPEEAVRKAKQDFVSILSANKELNLNVDSATLERSQPGRPVRRVELDFEKLLAADSTTSFDALVKSEKNTVVPLVVGDKVVTIVEVSRDDEGWKVIGLAGRDIAGDLEVLRQAAGDSTQHDVTLYEVPNLQARVYGVKREGREILFTNYGDRFSIRQGVPAAALTPILKADAVEFQRQYGDTLKRQPLVR
jgi:hypothetical protein